MALATLSVDLVAKVATFEADLKRVARTAEQQSDRMAAAFGLAKAGVAGLVGSLTLGASVAFFRGVVNGVDALNDLADATGASVENLSALEDIAARTGTSMDTVGGAVIKLNKTLADAKPGTDAAAALDALGLSAQELKRLDPAEALRRTAVALAGFADDGNKARLTQELFGKSLAEVAPLLKDLSEAGKLNATVTSDQAKAAEDFNKQLFNLQKNVVDAARGLTSELIPGLNKFFEALKGNKAGGGFFASIGLEFDANKASDRLRVVVSQIEDIQTAIDRQGATPLLERKMSALREEAKQLTAEATKASDALKAFAGVAKPLGGRPANEGGGGLRSRSLASLPDIGGPAAGKPTGGAAARLRSLEAAGLDEGTISALRAIESTDTNKIAALNTTLDALFAVRASGVGGDRATDEAIATVRDELSKLDPVAVAAAQRIDRVNAILAQTPTGQFQAVLKSIEDINIVFKDGTERTEEWAEAIRAATAQLPVAAEEAKQLGTFAEQAGRNIQDALGNTLEQVLAGNFSSIGDMWRNLLVQMAAQAAAAKLNSYLFGDTFGGKGSGAGVIGDLFKDFGGFFATGGSLGAGKWGIAGEAGPELIRGPANVVPNSAMGGTTVVINNTINGDVSPGTVKLVENAMGRVKADILRSSRTGGAYAGAY